MTLAEFLQQFVGHVYALWPIRIVREWEQGVRLFAGQIHPEPLTSTSGWWGTGIHAFWPLIGAWYTHPANIDVIETPAQTVRLATGLDVTFSLALRYRVHDAAALYAKIYDDEASVRETCRSAAGVVAQRMGLEDFAALGPGESGEIAKEARKQMHGWGVEVLRVQLLNLTVASALRLIQDAPLIFHQPETQQ